MQLTKPNVVPMAVRMLTSVWIIIFQVPFLFMMVDGLGVNGLGVNGLGLMFRSVLALTKQR